MGTNSFYEPIRVERAAITIEGARDGANCKYTLYHACPDNMTAPVPEGSGPLGGQQIASRPAVFDQPAIMYYLVLQQRMCELALHLMVVLLRWVS